MPKNKHKPILISLIFILVSCASQPTYQPRITDHPDATYENDVYPFIVEQINHTAATFFYDREKQNRNRAERGQPPELGPVGNVIVGKNEIGGVCHDYAIHFIENYKGLGDVYYV